MTMQWLPHLLRLLAASLERPLSLSDGEILAIRCAEFQDRLRAQPDLVDPIDTAEERGVRYMLCDKIERAIAQEIEAAGLYSRNSILEIIDLYLRKVIP